VACYHPLKAYKGPAGISFNSKTGYATHPIEINCGQCIGCRLERSRQWSVRCVHEAQMHERNSFVTLTYDDEHLPDNGSIDVKHWQDFAKRLRRAAGPFRYYHCGEYGETTDRPHYHALIFGMDFSTDRVYYAGKPGSFMYSSKFLDETWGQGACIIGELNFSTASYVARYILKKQTGKASLEYYERVDTTTGEVFNLKPPYTTMSRRPGIGKSWYEKYKNQVHANDEIIINGHQCKPPLYYDQQQDLTDPAGARLRKKRRATAGLLHQHNRTFERLAIRKEVKEAELKQHSRDNIQ